MKQWGIFTLKDDLDRTKHVIELAGFEVFEIREISTFEKILYLKPGAVAVDMWIVMFKATEDEYKLIVEKNNLTTVL